MGVFLYNSVDGCPASNWWLRSPNYNNNNNFCNVNSNGNANNNNASNSNGFAPDFIKRYVDYSNDCEL